MSRAAHLARLRRAAGQPLPRVSLRVALLTGQSRLGSAALSPQQLDFLASVAGEVPLMARGFPFDEDEEDRHAEARLPQASLANGRQWVWAQADPLYRARAARALGRLLGASDRTVLLTGSCGLAIAAAALRGCGGAGRVHLLALGPVGRMPEVRRAQAVQGRRDGWSRALYRGPAPTRIACGHLDYWTDPAARDLARAFVASA